MSEFNVQVVKIREVKDHENADSLQITVVNNGYPVIFKKGSFKENDLAVYIPVDSLVPLNNEYFSFLITPGSTDFYRIKAKRLRGVFSMGMLIKNYGNWSEGENVQDYIGIKKWEPELNIDLGSENEPDYGLTSYYDLKGLRQYKNVIPIGETVVISEKIHGTNSCFVWSTEYDRLLVKSHNAYKIESPTNLYWKTAIKYNLQRVLKEVCPDIAIFGEIFGMTKGFKYGFDSSNLQLRLFDAYNIKTNQFLDFDKLQEIVDNIDDWYTHKLGPTYPSLLLVPIISITTWCGLTEEIKNMAEGNSKLANHVKEGFVVGTFNEMYDLHIGRLKLKYHGEGFLTNKHS
ncbi:MAG: RNA ligase family protein [Bacteroidales bacterium]|jgi:RNA ligase (TIGR02306 family)